MDRATLQAFGRTYKVGVLDDKGAVKTMYEDEHGQKWIAVKPGDAFKVFYELVDSTLKGKRKKEHHRVQLWLDGEAGPWFADNDKFRPRTTWHGSWADGSGTKFHSYVFGEPGEDGASNRGDENRIEVTVARVRETKTKCIHTGVTAPAAKKQKKFYETHVEVSPEVVDAPGTLATYTFEPIDDERATCTIRYSTAEGLCIKEIISRQTHPDLFDDKWSRKHRKSADKDVKVEKARSEAEAEKKAKQEVIEIVDSD